MNILFLAQRVPYPPNKGDKLRSFNELKFLAQKHRITLLCLADTPEELQYEQELKNYCQSVDIVVRSSYRSKIQTLLSIFTNRPLTLPYFYSKRLQTLVLRKLQENRSDLIFVYCSSMAQYVESVQHISKVIDFVDVDSEKWHQYALHSRFPAKYLYRLESRRLRRYEASLAQTFHYCFLVSEKEVEDFRKFVYPCSTVAPLSNGVDISTLLPSQEPYEPHILVFTGTMDYFANVNAMLYFSRKILPFIQKVVPDVKLYIVGRNPAPEILKLGERYPNIIVTGYVDQVRPYLVKSAVFVAPMQIARGIQMKILEAMAMGVPVVTTSLGFEGIQAISGQDLFVEDHPERFAEQVIQLMQDHELRTSVSRHARRTIEAHYNWEKNLEQLEEILLEVVKT